MSKQKKNIELNVDLNEIASKAIQGTINDLERQVSDLTGSYDELRIENSKLEKELSISKEKNDFSNMIFDRFRKTYGSLQPTIESKEGWRKDNSQVRYEFICDVMRIIFGLNPTYGYVADAPLYANLGGNFYDNKSDLISVIKALSYDRDAIGYSAILLGNGNNIINKIKTFVHPKDYNKEQVLKYAKLPNTNTNGSYNGHYTWFKGWGTPHDFIQSNPLMLDDDVFAEVIESIKLKRGVSSLLFQMYKFANLTDDHIKQMGDFVVDFVVRPRDSSDYVKSFISDNLSKFSDKTISILFDKYIQSDNSYRLFHWDSFPIEYQYKYLLDKDIDFVLKTMNSSSNWSTVQKDSFLRVYYYEHDKTRLSPRPISSYEDENIPRKGSTT